MSHMTGWSTHVTRSTSPKAALLPKLPVYEPDPWIFEIELHLSNGKNTAFFRLGC